VRRCYALRQGVPQDRGEALFKSLVLAAAATALIACAAQSKPRADAVIAGRALVDKTTSDFAACQVQYARMMADDDRDFNAALGANTKNAGQPSLAEIKKTVAETNADFNQRDLALARKIHECDAFGLDEMNARDRLWQLCRDYADENARAAATTAEQQALKACH